MKCHNRSFRCSIVYDAWRCNEARHARKADDVAFVLLHHLRHKLSNEREVADDVDLEQLLRELIRLVEY